MNVAKSGQITKEKQTYSTSIWFSLFLQRVCVPSGNCEEQDEVSELKTKSGGNMIKEYLFTLN